MKRTLKLLTLTLSGGLAFAQAPVNYTGVVTNAIDQMTTNFSPLFLAEGQSVFTSIAVIMLVILGLKIARQSVNAHTLILPLDELIRFGFLFVLGEFMLRYWNTPSALLAGYSVHSIIPNIAYSLAGKINIAVLDTMTNAIDNILRNTPVPNAIALLQVAIYIEFTFLLSLVDGLLFLLTILGFVAVAIGTLVGPLMIPFVLVPRFEFLFYNWINFTVKYSFYQVIANALTFIWGSAFVYVISNLFGGKFDLAKGATEVVGLVLLTLGMLGSIWYVTHWASDLFSGTANAGASLAGSVRNTVTKGLAKLK